jgi:hypothetical protein
MEAVFRKEMEKLKRKDKNGKTKLDPSNIHFSTVDF